MIQYISLKRGYKMKHHLTMSRLNGTGVQSLKYNKLKVGKKIWFNGESYTILYIKRVKRGIK